MKTFHELSQQKLLPWLRPHQTLRCCAEFRLSVENRAFIDGSEHSHDDALQRDYEVYFKPNIRCKLFIIFYHNRFVIQNVSSDVYFGVRILTLNPE